MEEALAEDVLGQRTDVLRDSWLTSQQIAVPETLLKKRRTTEASREAKLQAAAEARKVGFVIIAPPNPAHDDAKLFIFIG